MSHCGILEAYWFCQDDEYKVGIQPPPSSVGVPRRQCYGVCHCLCSQQIKPWVFKVVLLDPKRSYDVVPCCKPQALVDYRYSPLLPKNIRTLLWAMSLKTMHQHSPMDSNNLSVVPHGDPPSPFLFNLFMNALFFSTSTNPHHYLSSLSSMIF